jgi:hypothetical protein
MPDLARVKLIVSEEYFNVRGVLSGIFGTLSDVLLSEDLVLIAPNALLHRKHIWFAAG